MSCFITVPLRYTLLGPLDLEDESSVIFHYASNSLGNDTVPDT